MYNFERFEAVGSTFVPKMSIRTNGAIGISQGALRRFKLEDGDWYVVLYYDKAQKVIGIKPSQQQDERVSTKIVKREVKSQKGEKNVTAYISGKSFLEYYAIPYNDRIRIFEPTWDEEHKLIIINLNEEKGGKA